MAGVLLNAIASCFAMYPHFFRQQTKRSFNRYSLDECIDLLGEPGVLIDMHSEGTRNTGADPYNLLPAFMLGLSNDLVEQVNKNFTRGGPPIVVVFGEPVNLDPLYEQSARLTTHKRIADHLMEHIRKLAEREREVRAALERAGAPRLAATEGDVR